MLALRENKKFAEHWELIDQILQANKSYGEKSKSLSKYLVENQVPGLFDAAKTREHRKSLLNENKQSINEKELTKSIF